MNSKWQLALLPLFAATLFVTTMTACDKTPAQKAAAEKEHFLSEKMQTIEKAKAVDQMIQDAAAQQHRNIDEQSN
jgi:hypothetical protein